MAHAATGWITLARTNDVWNATWHVDAFRADFRRDFPSSQPSIEQMHRKLKDDVLSFSLFCKRARRWSVGRSLWEDEAQPYSLMGLMKQAPPRLPRHQNSQPV